MHIGQRAVISRAGWRLRRNALADAETATDVGGQDITIPTLFSQIIYHDADPAAGDV